MSKFIFGSPEAAEQQFRDEMAKLDKEIAHLALTDDGEGWDTEPLRGQKAFVYFPADAPFPTPCTIFERRGDQVYVCIGNVHDMNSELILVDASKVTTESPQRRLFE